MYGGDREVWVVGMGSVGPKIVGGWVGIIFISKQNSF